MAKKYIYFIVLIISFFCNYTFAQTGCQVPLVPPVLASVSVHPETGMTNLEWTLSPESNIAGYIIYTYIEDQGSRGDPVDTLWNPGISTYSYINPGYKYFSTSYVVTALRLPDCEGPFSNILNTIFTEASLDTCNTEIHVSWNAYSSYPQNVTGYTVLVSVNGGNYTEAGIVSQEVTSYILDDFEPDSEYCFVVRANLEGGKYSTSNKSCVLTRMQTPPQWINADYATVTSAGDISLEFTIDPSSEIDLFSLEKKSGLSGTFNEIALVRTDVGSVTFTDKDADPSIVNYYMLSAINSCNVRANSSNIASNIVLSLEGTGNEIRLVWNKYRNWLGSVSGYRIFMDTGSGFIEVASVEPSDTLFSVSIPEIIYNVTTGEACFYVTAGEISNPHGITGESKSREICFVIEEVITVPNLFTPDGDSRNDLFKPVIAFSPSDYQLIISNRQGKVLFRSNDFSEAWDGSDYGDPVPEGVYMWVMRLTTPAGKKLNRTGTITVLKNR